MKSFTLRNIVLFTRVSAGLFSGASLAVFVIILFKVLDPDFPSTKPDLSALLVAVLSCLILWNIIALLIVNYMRPISYAISDSIASLILLVFGAVGFRHDDVSYLSNGQYQVYGNSSWLTQEIVGGSLLVVTLVLQLLLVLLNALGPRWEIGSAGSGKVPPPGYAEMEKHNEKEVDVECSSLLSWESSSSLKKPEQVKK